jgi:SHS2 domain-containing protein
MTEVDTTVHTAEAGIRVQAANAEDAFRSTAEAMFDLMVPNRSQVKGREEWQISASGDNWGDLLVGWLEELLFCYRTEHLVVAGITFETVDSATLEATISGERFDPERHESGVQIKAVTHRNLQVEQTDTGFRAQVIFDV